MHRVFYSICSCLIRIKPAVILDAQAVPVQVITRIQRICRNSGSLQDRHLAIIDSLADCLRNDTSIRGILSVRHQACKVVRPVCRVRLDFDNRDRDRYEPVVASVVVNPVAVILQRKAVYKCILARNGQVCAISFQLAGHVFIRIVSVILCYVCLRIVLLVHVPGLDRFHGKGRADLRILCPDSILSVKLLARNFCLGGILFLCGHGCFRLRSSFCLRLFLYGFCYRLLISLCFRLNRLCIRFCFGNVLSSLLSRFSLRCLRFRRNRFSLSIRSLFGKSYNKVSRRHGK